MSHLQPIMIENVAMLMSKDDQDSVGWTGTTNGKFLTKSHGIKLIPSSCKFTDVKVNGQIKEVARKLANEL